MPIEREAHGDVVVLRMAHGPVNALDLELLNDLIGTLAELSETAPPMVFTGAGRSFSAGVDLKRITSGGPEYIGEFLRALSQAFLALFEYPGPAVAAVNGHAIAGGFVLAAACDHRVVADGGARIGLSELQVGVPFPTAAIEIVRYAVGTAQARGYALGAELVGVREAHGFVDELVGAEVLEHTAAMRARARGDLGPEAYLLAKRQVQRPVWDNIERHAATEDAVVTQLWSRADSLARIQKFMESMSE